MAMLPLVSESNDMAQFLLEFHQMFLHLSSEGD